MALPSITYYLDVLSSWCLIADDALTQVRRQFGPRVEYDWRIAALRESLGYTRDQLQWYYRRTESLTGVRLNPVWLDSTADGSKWANLAAEAARGLGCTDDRARLALARGAMIEGKRVSKRDVAVEIAAQAAGLDAAALDRAIDDPATAERIRATSAEFAQLNVGVRPTFVLRNGIGDTTVLSGCWRREVLAGCVGALIDDQSAYETFIAANQGPAGVV